MKHLKSWFEKQSEFKRKGILMFGGGIIGTALMYLLAYLLAQLYLMFYMEFPSLYHTRHFPISLGLR